MVGTRNLLVGMYRTTGAVRAMRLGMAYYPDRGGGCGGRGGRVALGGGGGWEYYSLDGKDEET